MIKYHFLFGFSSFGKEQWWEGAAAFAAGLAAQLLVARDGTVTCKHFHLTEDRFVSHTGLICKTNIMLMVKLVKSTEMPDSIYTGTDKVLTIFPK